MSLLVMLGKMIELVEEEVDVFQFVTDEDLRERGAARGMWADFYWVSDPEKKSKILIWCDENLHAKDKLMTIAHELGHVRNFVKDYKRDIQLYRKHSEWPGTSVLLERYAWLYAVDVLKEIGFDDWDYFLETVRFSLDTYNNNECSVQPKEKFYNLLEKRIGKVEVKS